MSRIRWSTGIGIALGGLGGAIAALMGAPSTGPSSVASVGTRGPTRASASTAVSPALDTAPRSPTASAPAQAATTAPATALASASGATPAPTLTLELPTTREALLKAQVRCDRLKDFDECTRASQALALGTAGPADPQQAGRFRKIALTQIVAQCEDGSPHACFVLAAKFRAATEVTAKPGGAEALEKRAQELCRFRPAPECPR